MPSYKLNRRAQCQQVSLILTMAKYAGISWFDFLGFAGTFATLPFYVLWSVLVTALKKRRLTGLRKAALTSSARYINTRSSVAQLQYLSGTSPSVYASWARRHGFPAVIEDLRHDARLYWLGPKRTDKVILYIPGGAFFAPILSVALSFWNYVRKSMGGEGDVGLVVLQYSVLPEAGFPTQLRQICGAIDHLLQSGTRPDNIHIVADSAGGNLVLQFFSQLLHPLENANVEPIPALRKPFGSVYLLSPWTNLQIAEQRGQKSADVINTKVLKVWAKSYIDTIPKGQEHYASFLTPGKEDWFTGLGQFCNRIMVSFGGDECIKDDGVDVARSRLSQDGVDLRLEIQEGGVHDDPFWDFTSSDNPSSVGTLTPIIVEWLKEGLYSRS
ncbi:hypothetical protein CC1G_02147 [Coprinopsis cinerea okayama7|uniref:Alpha/beta hydrolase fold-3 domain-containing protein n=1 Tax=Coprinopsis cinerea (strain Okayama-7 / 130 / ATCC MYA-4618 / FGSC 9003) TaxID=240176 RepID=A8NKC7_COPC7|nr:hypothetical protein CC1G_02147 [Coprinopsis cinerea okayama7\|eukprot:XP_001834411.2 hypothetical protein CC1G_02147 [Coprinopsis cinerea okayama7\